MKRRADVDSRDRELNGILDQVNGSKIRIVRRYWCRRWPLPLIGSSRPSQLTTGGTTSRKGFLMGRDYSHERIWIRVGARVVLCSSGEISAGLRQVRQRRRQFHCQKSVWRMTAITR